MKTTTNRKKILNYFAGTERLASAIGNGGLADIGNVNGTSLADKRMERDSLLRRVMEPYPLRINRNRLDTLYSYSGPKLLATAEGHFWMMNNCTPIPIAIPNGTGFSISFSYSWNPQMVTNYNYSHLFHSYQYNFILKY